MTGIFDPSTLRFIASLVPTTPILWMAKTA